LFLNTWDAPERDYLFPIFQKLIGRGYRRFVEPCSGAFVMPSVAVEAGWQTRNMEMSDVSLFSSLLGFTFMEKRLDELDIRLDGSPYLFEREADGRPKAVSHDAAEALYLQLKLRMDRRPDLPYWNELREDIADRRDEHVGDIEQFLLKLDGRMHGCRYRPLDVWDHIREIADDPETVISINPPTYKGGFEKFFDTGGRLTWAEPHYEVFDASVDVFRLMEFMADKKALILCQQQQVPGNAADYPVFARYLSAGKGQDVGQYVYICTNKPDLVLELAGGLKVQPLKGTEVKPLPYPVIAPEYDITESSKVEFAVIGQKEAGWYRDLWMHKLDFRGAGAYVAIIVDGFLAGLAGYDPSPILRPYSADSKWAGCLLLTFAVGAPHKTRLTRLITMASLQEDVIKSSLNAQLYALVQAVITVELTKHPEAKGLRGIMKLRDRRKDPKYGNRLIYWTEIDTRPMPLVVQSFVQKEQQWLKSRKKEADRAVEKLVGALSPETTETVNESGNTVSV
jgi:hypothetical protein